MRTTKLAAARWMVLMLAGCLVACSNSVAQTQQNVSPIRISDLDRQIRDFLQTELTAHVSDIRTLDPPPERVVGALTTGEFSWGSFMRTLGGYSQFTGSRTIAGRDIILSVR